MNRIEMKEQLADFIKVVLKAPMDISAPVSEAMLDFVRELYEDKNVLSPTEYGFFVHLVDTECWNEACAAPGEHSTRNGVLINAQEAVELIARIKKLGDDSLDSEVEDISCDICELLNHLQREVEHGYCAKIEFIFYQAWFERVLATDKS